VRDKVAVYATGLYYTEDEFPTRLLDEAKAYVDEGFKGMKTKVGGLTWAEDVKRVTALREAIGPDIYLAVDANQA
jgi:D-galactarolactone cycloisomerase